MAEQGRSDFYAVFTMSLCALGFKTIVNKFTILNYTALILGVHALRSYLKLICESDFNRKDNCVMLFSTPKSGHYGISLAFGMH